MRRRSSAARYWLTGELSWSGSASLAAASALASSSATSDQFIGGIVGNQWLGLLQGRGGRRRLRHGLASALARPLEPFRRRSPGFAGHVSRHHRFGERLVVASPLLDRRGDVGFHAGLGRLGRSQCLTGRAVATLEFLEVSDRRGALGNGRTQRLALAGDLLGQLPATNQGAIAIGDGLRHPGVVTGQVFSTDDRADGLLQVEQGQRGAVEWEHDPVGGQLACGGEFGVGDQAAQHVDQPGAAQRVQASDHGDLTVELDRGAIPSALAHLEHLHCTPSRSRVRCTHRCADGT